MQLQHDSGLVVLYGALIPGSYKEFGLGPDARVKRGDPLGRIYPAGSAIAPSLALALAAGVHVPARPAVGLAVRLDGGFQLRKRLGVELAGLRA